MSCGAAFVNHESSAQPGGEQDSGARRSRETFPSQSFYTLLALSSGIYCTGGQSWFSGTHGARRRRGTGRIVLGFSFPEQSGDPVQEPSIFLLLGLLFVVASPSLPVFERGFEHCFGRFVQPAPPARGQILPHLGDGFGAPKVHVGGFPAHVIEKPRFISLFGQRGELDAGTVRLQSPH